MLLSTESAPLLEYEDEEDAQVSNNLVPTFRVPGYPLIDIPADIGSTVLYKLALLSDK